MIRWHREPSVGVRRAKRYTELSLELLTEIVLRVGLDGNFRRYKEGDIGLMVPYPLKWATICR